MSCNRCIRSFVLALSLAWFFAATTVSAALVADSARSAHLAEDVCTASVNPCVITQAIDVAAGSRLDFGLRTVRIQGAGQLDFAAGESELACGRLEVATTGVAIRARGDATAAGTASLLVRRRCARAASVPCLVDADCAAAGPCSGGDGAAVIDGGIHGSGQSPASVVVRSAGDLTLFGSTTIAATRAESDGGILELESTGGSVFIAGKVDVSGGGNGGGGFVSAVAAVDVHIRERIQANGGEYDGGSIAIEAARDVSIAADLMADSTSGGGIGGEIEAAAGRHLWIDGGTVLSNLVLATNGHQSSENYGGDGGTQTYEAGGDIVVSRHVRFSASAAAPDGFADSLSFVAGGDIRFDASVVAKGRGASGAGALVDLAADGDIRVSDSASFDLTGPAAGGDLMIDSGGLLSIAANVDVSTSASGLGGRVVAVAEGDADIAGHWITSGGYSTFSVGDLYVEGCQVRVSGELANSATAGRNRVVAHESLSILETASVIASGEGGGNSLRYRHASKPPLVTGGVTPTASLALDAALTACAACGTSDVDAGEFCDDRDFCSVGEVCTDGPCGEYAARSLVVSKLKVRLGGSPGRDRATWKAEFPATLLGVSPGATNLRVVLMDGFWSPVFDTTVPAGAFRGDSSSWRYKAPADVEIAGVVKASLAIDAGAVRARFKVAGMELDEALAAETLSLALLFGDEPGESPCASTDDLECERGPRKLSCASPPSFAAAAGE